MFTCNWVLLNAKVHERTAVTHLQTHTHISISSKVVLTVLCHAWTSAPFPHIYAKLGSCQSVTLVTQSPTSPIRADRAGLGGGRAPSDLPTCQSRAGHPHACLLSDPISVCQAARQPLSREEKRRVGWEPKKGEEEIWSELTMLLPTDRPCF